MDGVDFGFVTPDQIEEGFLSAFRRMDLTFDMIKLTFNMRELTFGMRELTFDISELTFG